MNNQKDILCTLAETAELLAKSAQDMHELMQNCRRLIELVRADIHGSEKASPLPLRELHQHHPTPHPHFCQSLTEAKEDTPETPLCRELTHEEAEEVSRDLESCVPESWREPPRQTVWGLGVHDEHGMTVLPEPVRQIGISQRCEVDWKDVVHGPNEAQEALLHTVNPRGPSELVVFGEVDFRLKPWTLSGSSRRRPLVIRGSGPDAVLKNAVFSGTSNLVLQNLALENILFQPEGSICGDGILIEGCTIRRCGGGNPFVIQGEDRLTAGLRWSNFTVRLSRFLGLHPTPIQIWGTDDWTFEHCVFYNSTLSLLWPIGGCGTIRDCWFADSLIECQGDAEFYRNIFLGGQNAAILLNAADRYAYTIKENIMIAHGEADFIDARRSEDFSVEGNIHLSSGGTFLSFESSADFLHQDTRIFNNMLDPRVEFLKNPPGNLILANNPKIDFDPKTRYQIGTVETSEFICNSLCTIVGNQKALEDKQDWLRRTILGNAEFKYGI